MYLAYFRELNITHVIILHVLCGQFYYPDFLISLLIQTGDLDFLLCLITTNHKLHAIIKSLLLSLRTRLFDIGRGS